MSSKGKLRMHCSSTESEVTGKEVTIWASSWATVSCSSQREDNLGSMMRSSHGILQHRGRSAQPRDSPLTQEHMKGQHQEAATCRTLLCQGFFEYQGLASSIFPVQLPIIRLSEHITNITAAAKRPWRTSSGSGRDSGCKSSGQSHAMPP